MSQRRIVQISTSEEHVGAGETYTVVTALCDDGSIWRHCTDAADWHELPRLPGTDGTRVASNGNTRTLSWLWRTAWQTLAERHGRAELTYEVILDVALSLNGAVTRAQVRSHCAAMVRRGSLEWIAEGRHRFTVTGLNSVGVALAASLAA